MTHSANSASMILAIALLVPTGLAAQTVTTNWVMTAPNVREVGGKFYNVDHSVLFTNFSGECQSVESNGIIVHEYRTQGIYRTVGDSLTSSGNFLGASVGGAIQVKIGERVIVDKDIFIVNFPTNLQATTGSDQRGRAMRIGVTNINGSTIELLDFGMRHTYPVVKTNLNATK